MTPLVRLIVVGAGGAAAAGFAVWTGWKNLRRSRVLGHPVALPDLGRHVGRCVAVRGRPEAPHPTTDPARGPRVWYRKTVETYNPLLSSNRHRHWSQVSCEVEAEKFHLHGEGGARVSIEGKPTEVHGSITDNTNDSLMVMPGTSRTRFEWLPAASTGITAVGRLVRHGNDFSIVPDDELGLLLSTHAAPAQARNQAIAGWLALVGAPLLWLATCAFMWMKYRAS